MREVHFVAIGIKLFALTNLRSARVVGATRSPDRVSIVMVTWARLAMWHSETMERTPCHISRTLGTGTWPNVNRVSLAIVRDRPGGACGFSDGNGEPAKRKRLEVVSEANYSTWGSATAQLSPLMLRRRSSE